MTPAPDVAQAAACGGGRLRARAIVCAPGHVLAPGEMRWDAAGRITALLPLRRASHCAPIVLFPGLVNAHAHLQLPALAAPRRDFTAWLRSVIAARHRLSVADQQRIAGQALRDLSASGATAVGEVDSSGFSPAVLAASGFAGRCYQELLGFDLGPAAAAGLLQRRAGAASRACPAGWSPHAPYSVSPALFRAAARSRLPLMVHCAEVPEEQQFLHTGRGPFRDLLASLGRLAAGFRAPGVGAIEWLDRLGVLRRGALLVHCQELEPGDVERIRQRGAAVVVCPGTIRWFRRTPPPVPQWLAAGIPVAIGTDSRASNQQLSMRAEIAAAAALWPDLPPAAILRMATVHGARGLARPALGRLRVGGRADFVAVDFAKGRRGVERADLVDLFAAFVHGESTLLGTWIAGRSQQHANARSRLAPASRR